MARNVDIVIIGAGSAGLSALSEVKKVTDNFLLINAGPYGTSCARVACMPSKAFIEAAKIYHSRYLLESLGCAGAAKLSVDTDEIMKFVRSLRDEFVQGMQRETETLGGNHIITGQARFKDVHSIEVNGEIIRAGKVIIATGSRPVLPDSWRSLRENILLTEEFFELRQLPQKMAVIGLGPAGLELAQALARLDVSVIAVEKSELIGGLSDPDVNVSAVQAIDQELELYRGTAAELSGENDQIRITFGTNEKVVDKVLLTMGREPDISQLGLEHIGIELNGKNGIPTFNPHTMQIGDLPIFIAGDANSYAPLLHEAVDEGHIAGYNAVHSEIFSFDRRVPLAVTFSEPNIVKVGKSFSELQDKVDYVVGDYDFSDQSRARMSRTNKGLLHVYADRENGRLLGAEMAAPEGEHLGHFLALAISRNLTVNDMLKIPFYHPVVEEGLRTALRRAHRQTQDKIPENELLLCRCFPPDCIT